jgi:hypothetical protein
LTVITFDEFWSNYPRKIGRFKAEQKWKRLTCAEQEDALHGLKLWKKTDQWNRDGGEFIPYGSTFLNQRRWEDEPWNHAFREFPPPSLQKSN